MSYDELALKGNNAVLNLFAKNESEQFPESWRRYMNDMEEMEYWAAHPILTETEKAAIESKENEKIEMPF